MTIFSFIANASLVVKFIMLLLILASVFSWAIIIERAILLKRSKADANFFEKQFWSGADVNELYDNMRNRIDQLTGIRSIFYSGFDAYKRMCENSYDSPNVVMDSVQRSMRVANSRETDRLQKHLGFLATVGSTSVYVGLLGTVWGIMTTLSALGHADQATIAMVAPGISETLIATAMGLFAAIPARVAYNRFSTDLDRLNNTYENFQEEFFAILHRQSHTT